MNHGAARILSFFVLGTLLIGCSKGESSLFDPNYEAGTPAEISAIEPADSAESGSEVVIAGSNFSSTPEQNFVYFDAREATVLEASASELTVQVPAITGDSIDVRVAVAEVEDFSNVVTYTLY